jgi:hypothetical protein
MKEKEIIYKNINGIQIELNEEEYKEYYIRLEEHEKNLFEQMKLKPAAEEPEPIIKKQVKKGVAKDDR